MTEPEMSGGDIARHNLRLRAETAEAQVARLRDALRVAAEHPQSPLVVRSAARKALDALNTTNSKDGAS
jgi:hypothetical protein